MGQVATSAQRCAKRLLGGDELEKQRAYEKSVVGLPGSLKTRYEVQDLLADGTHGQIYLLSEYGTGRKMVLKAYRKEARSFQNLDVTKKALAVKDIREGRLSHESLVRYYNFYESKDLFCTVSDYSEGGSVRAYLEKKMRLDEHTASKVFAQLLQPIIYLHSREIVHRDLRLEQYLFVNKRHAKIRLSDLMHAARPAEGFKVVDKTKPVVLLFAAPESLAKGEYSTMSDMWSAGCMLYELLHGHPPYTGEDRALVRRILEDPVVLQPKFTNPSKEAVQLLKGLLNKEPFARLAAEKCKSQRWFSESMQISARQSREELERRRRLNQLIEEARVTHAARFAKQEEIEEEVEQVVLRNQFSKSLTGTCSHLSGSTASDEEDVDEPLEQDRAFLEAEGDDDDKNSQDWQMDPARSDLQSIGAPESGADSKSDTYVNSEENWLARTMGDWDEFDSEFFEEDREASSCWSEAEFSDWTADDYVRRQQDADFVVWVGPLGGDTGSDSDSSSSSSSQGSSSGTAETTVKNSWGTSKSESALGGSDEGWGSSSSSYSSSKTGSRSQSRSSATGSSIGDTRKQKQAGKAGKAASSVSSSGWGSSSSEELERSARDRSGFDGSSGSSRSSGTACASGSAPSAGSAPWDFTERSGDSGSSGSSTSGGSQKGKARHRGRPHKGGTAPDKAGSQLAPIAEGAPLVVASPAHGGGGGGGRKGGDDLGELTNRSLAAQAAPWETHAGAALPPRPPGSQGMIVMSRRSNSSSSSSQRDSHRSRNEFELAQQRSNRSGSGT